MASFFAEFAAFAGALRCPVAARIVSWFVFVTGKVDRRAGGYADMANFTAVWKDCGFLKGSPPFLVVPKAGIGLVYLNEHTPQTLLLIYNSTEQISALRK